MSYDLNASLFTLNFTDGSFITMLNGSDVNPVFRTPLQQDYIIPNFYMGDFDGSSYSVLKFDADGNSYEFSNHGVIINGTIRLIDNTHSRLALQYNPSTESLALVYLEPNSSSMPYVQVDRAAANKPYGYTGLAYHGDMSGSQYSSFGQLLAEAEATYNEQEQVGDYYTRYKLENIVEKSKNLPFYGTNIFYGDHAPNLNRTIRDLLVWTGVAVYQETTIDIKNVIGDFNPVLPDPIPDPGEDPFNPGGNTGPGGGGGDFDGTGDDIEEPDPPTLTAADTGFITLFNPSLTQLKNLASYMWSGLFDIATYKKLFADPMDCILGLSIVPVAVPNGTAQEVKVGNIGTGINMTTAASQYVQVDCGSINVNEYWGAYLDYEPYTKAEIYLPYIGTHPVSIDDIMGKTVSVKYTVDILSGACTAFIKCGGSVLYEFIGQCSSSIPVNANDWTNVINGVLSIAGAIGTMVATGGMSAPISAGAALGGASMLASTAVNSMKPSVEKSGAMSGTGGMLAVQVPYIILTRPRQALPRGQNSFMGYPSFMTEYLGSLSGYTEVESIHLTNIPATDEELQEIEMLLKKGVEL